MFMMLAGAAHRGEGAEGGGGGGVIMHSLHRHLMFMMLAGAVHRGDGGDVCVGGGGGVDNVFIAQTPGAHDAGRCCASWWRRWWRTWRMLGDSGRPVFTPRCWSSLVASPPRWDVCCCCQHEIVCWLLVLLLVTASGFLISDFPLLVPAPFLSSPPWHRMTFPFLPDRNLQDDKTLKCNYWFVLFFDGVMDS